MTRQIVTLRDRNGRFAPIPSDPDAWLDQLLQPTVRVFDEFIAGIQALVNEADQEWGTDEEADRAVWDRLVDERAALLLVPHAHRPIGPLRRALPAPDQTGEVA